MKVAVPLFSHRLLGDFDVELFIVFLPSRVKKELRKAEVIPSA